MKNTDHSCELQLATLQQIVEELRARDLPFVFLLQEPNGIMIAHQPTIGTKDVMLCFVGLLAEYINSTMERKQND